MELMFAPFRKYATFQGRARRKEYWLFSLFVSLAAAILFTLSAPIGDWADTAADPASLGFGNPLMSGVLAVFLILILLPSLAVTVRRLHDSDRSGWWLLLSLLPLIGGLILLIFYLLDGTPGHNRFGPDPKGREAADA